MLKKFLLGLFCLLLITGCDLSFEGPAKDTYSQISTDCDYTTPTVYQQAGNFPSRLTPACRKALLSILTFDPSIENAPAGLKERILEAYQALAAYPLEVSSEGRILGVAPYTIPTSHLNIFNQFPQMKQSIFNYVVARTEVISYQPVIPGAIAELTFDISGKSVVTISDLFWKKNTLGYPYSSPFVRAALLVHEARHTDAYFHNLCDTKNPDCDGDFNGPYGLMVTYLEFLLHGGGNRGAHGEAPLLDNNDLRLIGTEMYSRLRANIDTLQPELQDVVKNPVNEITAEWVIKREGLKR